MIRILALDGGGARGIIELAVLSSIESVTEKPSGIYLSSSVHHPLGH